MPTAEPIDANYTEQPYEPSAVPPTGITRADVLTQARILAAEINGVAALVEQHAARLRPEVVDAWRKWAGAWVGYHIALERLPFEAVKTDDELKRRSGRLRQWREGLAAEVAMFTAPQAAPAAAAPVAQPAPTEKKGWPWWAVVLGIGGGGILLWKVSEWIFTPSYTSTAQVVADVAQTADAVNAVRRERGR